jgi:hypothetical protein
VIADAVAEVVTALMGAGQRVAVRSGDITPPVWYLQLGQTTNASTLLAGGVVVTLYVHYIPVRGLDNLDADSEALDVLYDTLGPLAVLDLVATRTSVTINNDTWPCYRADLAALAV